MSITVTALPESMDPNRILRNKILDKEGICPFCSSKGEICRMKKDKMLEANWNRVYLSYELKDSCITYYNRKWFGDKEGKKHFFNRKMNDYWMRYEYKCSKCKAKWIGEAFPAKLKGAEVEA